MESWSEQTGLKALGEKTSKTRRPRKSDSETCSPSWFRSEKSGAVSPTAITEVTGGAAALPPQAQVRDDLAVTVEIGALEIAQEAPPFADHHQEAAPRVVVLAVSAQVLGQVVDALG